MGIGGVLFLILIGFLWYKFPRTITQTETETIVEVQFDTVVIERHIPQSRIRVKKNKIFQSSVSKSESKKVQELTGFAGYTRYQMLMWHLKAEEQFRSSAYADGDYYSIGFGFNMHPQNKEVLKRTSNLHLINGWGKGATTTWENAVKLTQIYLENAVLPNLEDKGYTVEQEVAIAAHAYNTGKMKIGPCCGGIKRCGKGLIAHNRRRLFEYRLYYGQVKKREWDKIKNTAFNIEKRK